MTDSLPQPPTTPSGQRELSTARSELALWQQVSEEPKKSIPVGENASKHGTPFTVARGITVTFDLFGTPTYGSHRNDHCSSRPDKTFPRSNLRTPRCSTMPPRQLVGPVVEPKISSDEEGLLTEIADWF